MVLGEGNLEVGPNKGVYCILWLSGGMLCRFTPLVSAPVSCGLGGW